MLARKITIAAALGTALLLGADRAVAWWTTLPNGTPVWDGSSAETDNDHGYLAAKTIEAALARRTAVAAELDAHRAHFLYGVWAEDFVTGGTLADHLYAATHHWDGGQGAPAMAQYWFDAAVAARRLGLKASAYESLGRALHYLQDMTHGFHSFSPLDPDMSGVFCLHQTWYGFDDYRSHCHSVVELRTANRAYALSVPAIPSFVRSKEPGFAATEWARKVHGKNESEMRASVGRWHDAVRRGDWATVDARVPALFGRAVAAGAGLVEAFGARAGM